MAAAEKAKRDTHSQELLVSDLARGCLWQIAELLETKVALLIPSPEELLAPRNQTVLDKQIMKQIEDVANGNPATIKVLTGV